MEVPINDDRLYPSIKGYIVHLMVAKTFLEIPECLRGLKKIQINHIDGDIKNYQLDNLEWVSPQENIVHACETGLIANSGGFLAKDTTTGEVHRFYSMQECARFFKTNAANIHHYLNSKYKNRLRFEKYLIIREGDEWPETIDSGIVNGLPKKIEVTNVTTGEVKIYNRARELALEWGVSISAVTAVINRCERKILNGEDYSYRNLRLRWCTELPQYSKECVSAGNKTNSRKPSRIEVTYLDTGKVEVFDSSDALAEKLGVKKSSLQLKLRQFKHNCYGMRVRYLDQCDN